VTAFDVSGMSFFLGYIKFNIISHQSQGPETFDVVGEVFVLYAGQHRSDSDLDVGPSSLADFWRRVDVFGGLLSSGEAKNLAELKESVKDLHPQVAEEAALNYLQKLQHRGVILKQRHIWDGAVDRNLRVTINNVSDDQSRPMEVRVDEILDGITVTE
jgi:hypothetical protein